jgi:hypothetical protein
VLTKLFVRGLQTHGIMSHCKLFSWSLEHGEVPSTLLSSLLTTHWQEQQDWIWLMQNLTAANLQ